MLGFILGVATASGGGNFRLFGGQLPTTFYYVNAWASWRAARLATWAGVQGVVGDVCWGVILEVEGGELSTALLLLLKRMSNRRGR